MHPLRLGPDRAGDRTWSQQGVSLVDSQFLPLSAGVSGAVKPRGEETGHFEVHQQPLATQGVWASPTQHLNLPFYLFAVFDFLPVSFSRYHLLYKSNK